MFRPLLLIYHDERLFSKGRPLSLEVSASKYSHGVETKSILPDAFVVRRRGPAEFPEELAEKLSGRNRDSRARSPRL